MILMKYKTTSSHCGALYLKYQKCLFCRKITSVSEILLYDIIRFYDVSNKDQLERYFFLLADLIKGKIC